MELTGQPKKFSFQFPGSTNVPTVDEQVLKNLITVSFDASSNAPFKSVIVTELSADLRRTLKTL